MKFIITALLFLLVTSLSARTNQEQYAIADDGTPLSWTPYAPKGPGTHPVVLVIPGGGFRNLAGLRKCAVTAEDLANAGFMAFVIQYRLAPPGSIPNQRAIGYYPAQTNDVHKAVEAARSDPRGDGAVGVVGGSAGGSHAAYVASTGVSGEDRVDIAVCLSGAYNFSDPDSLAEKQFDSDVTNYVDATDPTILHNASPIVFVGPTTAPIYLFESTHEAMPFSQYTDMIAALNGAHLTNYKAMTLNGSLHSFDYWPQIKTQAIAFLQTVLK